jgi:hypothetical protein
MGSSQSKPPSEARLLDLFDLVIRAEVKSAVLQECQSARQKAISDILRLLEELPSPDLALTRNGMNALHLACYTKCDQVALRILSLRSDAPFVNSRTGDGKTALALCEQNFFGPPLHAVVSALTACGATA